ncbi:MAG: hypothetical protein ABJA66_05285, partial [Actinomycetota bacterium]
MSEENKNFFKTNRELIIFILLSLFVLLIYWQTTRFDFINLDDNLYVYENPVVLGGLNWNTVKWAFTAFYSANWHPLTWLAHALDVQIFGRNAGGHHAVNVIFHLINSILAFAVFRRMTGCFWKSAIVAALFAVHPAHVESVAWIAERKDVLSTLFWLLTTWAYLLYAETKVSSLQSPVSSEEETQIDADENATKAEATTKLGTSDLGLGTKFYVLTILLFALGLMAKPMLVTLPFTLILIDYWSLERLKTLKDLPKLVREKLPLFALSIASSYLTILAQKSAGAVETLNFLPVQTRILNAFVSSAKYLVMLFYPANLGVWYPYKKDFAMWQIGGAIVLLAAITALCVRQMRRRKYLLMGWLWFLGTLVPVIGLVQVGSQSLADRYTYVPFFGLFIMLVWGLGDLFAHFKVHKKIVAAICAIALLIFGFLAYKQTSLWKSS